MIKIANSIFPGVYVSINDQSQYVESVPGAIGFICILSEKGPDNKPVMVTSISDLVKRYGTPSIRRYGQAWYVAREYLETLSNLWVMRVLPRNAKYATLALKLKQNDDVVTTYKVEKVNGKEILTEIGNNSTTDKLVSVDELNSTAINEILSTVEERGTVTFPVAVINRSARYTEDLSLRGARHGEESDAEARTDGETEFNGALVGDTTLRVDGFTFSEYAFTNTYANTTEFEITNCRILGLKGAAATIPDEYNRNLPIEVDEEENVHTKTVTTRPFYFENVPTISGTIEQVPDMDKYLSGEDSAADIIFYPYGRGEYYNKLGIKLTKAKKSYPNAFILDVYEIQRDSTASGLVESFEVSFDVDAKDISGASLFVKDVLDMYSEYIRCEVSDNFGNYLEDTSETDKETGHVEEFGANYDDLAMTTIEYLSGGSDGTMYDKNGNLDWNAEVSVDEVGTKENMTQALCNAYCGLNINPETGEPNEEITDTENMDFTVVFDAGWPYDVKTYIESLCDSRQSCFGFLDNGVASNNGYKGADKAIKARQEYNTFNNYRLALYEPYTKLYDTFTGTYYWATPIIHAVHCFTRTARDRAVWWAFAGLNRGACSGIRDYRYKLAGGYKDMFKENELNPIMRFNQGGDVIWGNWTTQQTPSALKNIHVVLCLQYIHRTLERNLKQYIYEFNDTLTYSKISNTVNAFLSELQAQRALENFSVSVGATDYQKRNNQCTVSVDLQVTGVIEIINVTLNVN